MKRARWRNHIGLPVLLLTALLSAAVTPAAMSAGLRLAASPGIDCLTVTPLAAARAALAPASDGIVTHLESKISKRGELTGRVLSAQTASGRALAIALPVESFIGPLIGGLVVYTRHLAATGSEVRALNLATGCDVRLAAPPEIVRSAVLDRSAEFAYVHSVTGGDRADAGVVRYDLDSGIAVHVLGPVRPPDGFGPIFGTDLRWSIAGDQLAVQSCGYSRCLTRVLDVATGGVSTLDDPEQGGFIALTNAHLVTFASCPGMPCAVLTTDLASGAVTVLEEEAVGVHIESSGTTGAMVWIETPAGDVEVVQ